MFKSKSNLIETGILSIGIFVAGLGIQGNAKAAVNQTHSKVKYGSHKKHYTVSPRVSYFNVSNSQPQSTAANAVQSSSANSFQANSFATTATSNSQSTVAKKSHATESKKVAYQATRKAAHHVKKTTTDYNQNNHYQGTSYMTKLKPKKHVKNKYNAHVHKATASENSVAVQTTNGFSTFTSSSSSALSSVSQQSISYRDAVSSSQSSASSSSAKVQASSSAATADITDQTIKNLITESKRYLGASYEYGGTGVDGSFDCSGFTQYLYQHQNVSLPRTAQQQYDSYQHVDASQAKAGDLVFFGSDENDISHVGIYLGNGQMIDAQDQGVIIEAVNAPWWNLIGYARITN